MKGAKSNVAHLDAALQVLCFMIKLLMVEVQLVLAEENNLDF